MVVLTKAIIIAELLVYLRVSWGKMGLKLSKFLFTGPFSLDKTVVRRNQNPVVFAIVSKEGEPWNPVFRLIDVGASDLSGIQFSTHPNRATWEETADGEIGVYVLDFSRKEVELEDKRSEVVDSLKAAFDPPNGFIPLQGNM